MKFDWVLLKVIYLDVNSDVNSQTVFDVVLQAPSAVLRQLPCEFGEVWLIIAEVINELGVKFDWLLLKVIHLDVNSAVILNRFPCNFAGTIGWYYVNCPVNLANCD